MAEVKAESKITAPKLLVFIGMLYTIFLAITYFYAPLGNFGLNILWGILCLVIAFLIFLTLDLISFGPLKIPYQWWLILIFGAILIVFAVFFGGSYFAGILLLIAAFVELFIQKKPYKASKIVLLIGIGFSVYDCFLLFLSGNALRIVNGVFGLILLILLIIVLFDFVDLKVINYSWWVVLLIGFVIFIWISPFAVGFIGLAGFGGTLILIAFVLMVLAL